MRRRALVLILFAAVLGAVRATAEEPKRLLLIGQGPDGHPPATHEFMAGLRVLEHVLARVPNLEITTVKADDSWPEGPALIREADGVVLYLSQGARWIESDPRRLDAMAELASRGGGIAALHWAIGAKDPQYIETCLAFLGGCHGGPDRKYVVMDATVQVADRGHPVTRGIDDFDVHDEFYYRLKFVQPDEQIEPIVQVAIDGRDETVAWGWRRPDGGRSFGFSGMHFHRNWELEAYRRLAAQGVLWTLDLPIDGAGIDVSCPDDVLEHR